MAEEQTWESIARAHNQLHPAQDPNEALMLSKAGQGEDSPFLSTLEEMGGYSEDDKISWNTGTSKAATESRMNPPNEGPFTAPVAKPVEALAATTAGKTAEKAGESFMEKMIPEAAGVGLGVAGGELAGTLGNMVVDAMKSQPGSIHEYTPAEAGGGGGGNQMSMQSMLSALQKAAGTRSRA